MSLVPLESNCQSERHQSGLLPSEDTRRTQRHTRGAQNAQKALEDNIIFRCYKQGTWVLAKSLLMHIFVCLANSFHFCYRPVFKMIQHIKLTLLALALTLRSIFIFPRIVLCVCKHVRKKSSVLLVAHGVLLLVRKTKIQL